MRTKADRRRELAELMAKGAKVTVLASQVGARAAKPQIDDERLARMNANRQGCIDPP
jgi:starvation-inducible outer membrane lipoprotein